MKKLIEWFSELTIADIKVVDFSWELDLIILAAFIALVGGFYYLFVWLFGKLELSKAERIKNSELCKEIKQDKKEKRKLKGKEKSDKKAEIKNRFSSVHGASGRVLFWNMKLKKVLIPVVSVILCLSLVIVPIYDSVGELLIASIFQNEQRGDVDSEAAKLAQGESRENVITLEEEGAVLVKNNDSALPLDATKESDKKINMFGAAIFGMLYGGGGSGIFVTNNYYGESALFATRLEKAMTDEGFEYNPYLYNLVANYYESKTYKLSETDYDIQCQLNSFPSNTLVNGKYLVKGTCLPENNEVPVAAYNKTYTETGGETLLEQAKSYSDTAMYCISRAGSEDGDLTYNQTVLTEDESAVIEMLKENFGKVIVLINSSNVMELSTLKDDKVDAVLWIGHPGLTGNTGVARIISGKVNPSGKLADTWTVSSKNDPSSLMYGRENQYSYSGSSTNYQVYYEGVYIGYRYYATRAMTDDSFNYNDYVIWSFGHGLSYTTFEKHITESTVKDGKVSVQVAVKNTGNVAGKEVVELYFNAPYSGNIEKPYYELAAFAKTDSIKPGDTYFARLEFDVSDMASYDSAYNGGNGAYVLEKGEYNISLRDNVWDKTISESGETEFTYPVDQEKTYVTDSTTGYKVENLFSDVERGPFTNEITYLSRSDWEGTYPTADKIDKKPSLNVTLNANVNNADNQIEDEEIYYGVDYGMTIGDMAGLSYNDKKWDYLLDQMTLKEQCDLIDNGRMQTVQIDSIKKIRTYDDDGPASVELKGVGHVSEVVCASSWNTACAQLFGESIAKEGAAIGLTGWYAPGLNMHRTAMGGRNFEYYSEDPLLSGLMGGYVTVGTNKYGVYTYCKHFLLNDQETNRSNLQVWANEQSIREIYGRSFEIAVKTATANNVKSLGIMSSFTTIGTTWAGASYNLQTELLRNEWGFQGVVITDWTNNSLMPTYMGLRAGNDLWLGRNGSYDAAKAYTSAPHDMKILIRNACHNILYAIANSNAVWTDEQFTKVGIDGVTRTYSRFS